MGEYLVEGAKLICVNGSQAGMLKMMFGHGFTIDGKRKANCLDCKPIINIPWFGSCKKNEKTKLCTGFMELETKWLNTKSSGSASEKVGGQDAIDMDCVLICRKGGLIMPMTSGQGYDKGVDMVAFTERYVNVLRWLAGTEHVDHQFRCNVFGKDPINMNTGNFIYEREELFIGGPLPLSFHMFYNVMEDQEGSSMGEGWRHNFEIHLRIDTVVRTITVCRGDGKEILYRPTLGDSYMPIFGDQGRLNKESNGYRYCAVEEIGYMEYTFDRKGKLLTRTDRNGNKDIFSHNQEGRIIAVKGAGGGELSYTYNQAGRLIHITDHTEREVMLTYRYGKLWRMTTPAGAVYTYIYNCNNKLESIITPRGIMGVKNEYDSVNRVLKQITPDGGAVEFRYDDINNRTYMKEQNGKIIIYESDKKFRNIRTAYFNSEEIFEYNDANQRTLYIDRNGNKTRYHYDFQGNMTRLTDALGHETVFNYQKDKLLAIKSENCTVLNRRYDESGRLIESADALNRTSKITYGNSGHISSFELPDGGRYFMDYDSRGNLIRFIDPYEIATVYTYDELNRLSTVVDAQGNTTAYEYDKNSKLICVTNPQGNCKYFSYDESGNIIIIKDYDGTEQSAVYNDMNLIENFTDSQGRKTRISYDKMGNIAEKITPAGSIISYCYDRANLLETVEIREKEEADPAVIFTYAHDPAGNLLCVKTGDGEKTLSETHYEYDALNRVIAVIDPVGGRTAYTYVRSSRRLASITDPLGNLTTYRYNKAGELTAKNDSLGNVTAYHYNTLGKLTELTDGAGRTTRYHYAPGGRLLKIISPDKQELSYEYDDLGRIAAQEDGRGFHLTISYDTLSRPVKVTGSDGQEKFFAYDAAGKITSVSESGGYTTRYEYTLSGKLAALIDVLGNRTEYGYDAADRLIYICQQEAKSGRAQELNETRETYFRRSSLGLIEAIQDALGGTEYFAYDALGNVIEKTDRCGSKTFFGYTPDSKLESILYGDGTRAEFGYTPLRQNAYIRDGFGEIQIQRDGMGRPEKVIDQNGQAISYEWGTFGERKSITYPDGNKVNYRYDDLLRLETMFIERPEGEEIRAVYSYGNDGKIREKEFSQGFKTVWDYDKMGRLKELVHMNKTVVLERFTYGYDQSGNKAMVSKERRGLPGESGNYLYHYDPLNRLTGVERDGKLLRDYCYDSFGNRTGMVDYERDARHNYTYNVLNQLLTEEITQGKQRESMVYQYDKRGNLTGEYCNGNLRRSYEYNVMNRLESTTDGNEETTYRYNAIGQRTGKDSEEYLLDLTKPYHNLLGVRSKERVQNYYWDFTIAAMSDQENQLPRLYFNDEMGSPLRLLFTTGKADTYGYDEFGNEPVPGRAGMSLENPISYTKQGIVQPFGYAGYRMDESSGNYFAQTREYLPRAGRFSGEDIIRGNAIYPYTLNRYGYCYNNPLKWVDLDGKKPVKEEEDNLVVKFMQWILEDSPFFEDKIPDEPDYLPSEQMSDNAREVLIDVSHRINETADYMTSWEYLDNVIDVELQAGIGASVDIKAWGQEGSIGGKSVYIVVNEHGEYSIKSEIGGSIKVLEQPLSATMAFNWNEAEFENELGFELNDQNSLKVSDAVKFNFGLGAYYIYGGGVDISVNFTELVKPIKDLFNCKSTK